MHLEEREIYRQLGTVFESKAKTKGGSNTYEGHT
jgi:hypothetical protein